MELKELELLLKEHNHDGSDTTKINASAIELNTTSFKTFNSTRVSEALKNIDDILIKKQNIISGKNGFLVSYSNSGISEIDPDYFSKKEHIHNYIKIPDNILNGNLIIWNNKLENANCKASDFIRKSDLEVFNNKIKEIEQKFESFNSHSHKNYIDRIKGNNNLTSIDMNGNLINTNINPINVVIKSDIEKIVNVFTKSINDIYIKLDSKSEKEHIHSNMDLSLYIKKSDIPLIVEDIVKKVLKEMLNK